MGIDFGNWGNHAPLADDAEKRDCRDRHDNQIIRGPAHIVILCEANHDVEEALKRAGEPPAEPPRETALADTSEGEDHPQSRLQRRASHERWVVRGGETSSLLIAARTDTCLYLELLDFDVNDDHRYREKG